MVLGAGLGRELERTDRVPAAVLLLQVLRVEMAPQFLRRVELPPALVTHLVVLYIMTTSVATYGCAELDLKLASLSKQPAI